MYLTANTPNYSLLKAFARENRAHATEAEAVLWKYLRDRQLGFEFRRQHIVFEYIADFICVAKKLIIEVDGKYHSLPEQQVDDATRQQHLEDLGYTVIRFTNEAILCDTDNTLDMIRHHLNTTLSSLPPSGGSHRGASPSPSRGKSDGGLHIHFIAIGGAAMHNLALAVASKQGYVVTGSDDEIFDPALTHLREAGLLPDEMGWHPERITSDIDAIILGMHAREDNPELVRARELGLRIYSFPEYLYEQTKDKIRIVVGGSHGKTTTTSMILYVLNRLGIEADYMVGAQIEGFERMVRLSDTAKYAVFEGDEYLTSPLDLRSKFLWYKPHIAILTGIAWDHINVFPTFPEYVETFRKFTKSLTPRTPSPEGEGEIPAALIYYERDENLRMLAGEVESRKSDRCAVGSQTATLSEIRLLPYREYTGEVEMGVFGKHNMQNLQAACLACEQIGVKREDFYREIASFTGASNRLQVVGCRLQVAGDRVQVAGGRLQDAGDRVQVAGDRVQVAGDRVQVADGRLQAVAYKDFAHSPSKLKATVNAVREQYPNMRLVAAMELHTFSSLMADFLPQYKDCMKEADVALVYFNPKVIEHKRLTPITKEEVAAAFGTPNIEVFTESEALQARLRQEDYNNTALLMMSSGTFDGINVDEFARELLTSPSPF